MMRLKYFAPAAAIVALTLLPSLASADFGQSPMLAAEVADGKLPPVDQRLPQPPRVIETGPGAYGGDLRIAMARSRDTRLMTVYGYARLVGYDSGYNLVPDILESFETVDDKVFTFKLRRGHKWSDGHPFTTEDFRYWWEDMANNPDLSPLGPPILLKVDGEVPNVEILDEHTIRFSWSKPVSRSRRLPKRSSEMPSASAKFGTENGPSLAGSLIVSNGRQATPR